MLVTEPDGGAAPVRTQGGDLREAHRQSQAARGARGAHVSGHPRQAQCEPFPLTASAQDACPMRLHQNDMRYAGCAMPPIAVCTPHLALPPLINETSCNM